MGHSWLGPLKTRLVLAGIKSIVFGKKSIYFTPCSIPVLGDTRCEYCREYSFLDVQSRPLLGIIADIDIVSEEYAMCIAIC